MCDYTEEDSTEEKSKSQIKREMLALQDLAMRLTGLKTELLAQMPLSDRLRTALDESKKHSTHIARKRHNQYLGKLLRSHDIAAIQTVLNRTDNTTRQYNERFHALERWRERLISDGNTALQEFMQLYTQTDSQHLRGLIRQAQQEQAQEKPPAAARKIFRYLRELDEQRLGDHAEAATPEEP